jgi:hypothetical protein
MNEEDSPYFDREELYNIFSLEQLKELYKCYVRPELEARITSQLTMSNMLHRLVPKHVLNYVGLAKGDLVQNLIGDTYRVMNITDCSPKGPKAYTTVYELSSGEIFAYNSFLMKVPTLGFGSNIDIDLRRKLLARFKNKNFIYLDGNIVQVGRLYVWDEEMAVDLLEADAAWSKEVLIKMIDD